MITPMWDNAEKTIILVDYAAPVLSWDEYMLAVHRQMAMVQSQSHAVHLIHNTHDVPMPKGNALMYIRRAIEMQPANIGMVFMIIGNPFARRILETVVKMLPRYRNLHFAQSLEEAYQQIELVNRAASQRVS